MPAYNPPQQVLFEPVTNYYKGKAIRQAYDLAEKESAQKDRQLDIMDERLKWEKEKERKAEEAKAAEALEEQSANMLIGITDEYEARKADNPDAALEWYGGQMATLIEQMEDGDEKDRLIRRGEDGWQEDDVVGMRSEALAYKGALLQRGQSKKDHKTFHHPATGQEIAARPDSEFADELVSRGFLPGPPSGKTDFSASDRIKLAEKFTAESIREFAATGYEDSSVLVLKEGKAKKATAAQFKAGGFAARIEEANFIFDELEGEGEDFTNFLDRLSGSNFWPTGAKSDARQKYEQAQRNFINAVLRRESGAAIAPSEFESAEKQYFPVPGDKEDVVLQKRRNRKIVEATLKAEAGPAMKMIEEEIGNLPTYLDSVPAPPAAQGQTATNPETGERIVFHNGEWIPLDPSSGNE